ncbi:MAG: branched-chain amino acid ABC transporter permease [Solirubrobacteraceae bacterium]
MRNGRWGIEAGVGLVLVVFALLAPVILSTYWIATLMTQMLILGICAASLIFLSAYGGMVSLAQLAIYGIAGFALGNFTTNGNTKGLNLGWAIGPGVVVAVAIAVLFAVIFGALANRSYGIYFLMITLVFSVIVNLVFGQVTSISGFGGISGIRAPGWINPNAHPARLYLVTLVVALALLTMLRYMARTPFGLALQGIRDDPQRMRTLGYSVALHRTAAFALAGFVAALGGILYVWWNGQISPSAIALPNTINILVIAVIGGLYRVEAAWLGALVFVVLNNYAESIGFIGARFNTWIGVVFLVIVVVSPNGLIGLWDRSLQRLTGTPRADAVGETAGEKVPQAEPTRS